MRSPLSRLIQAGQSAFLFGPRQAGDAGILADYPAAARGYVINDGAAVEQLSERIWVLPWRSL